jgi:hypothetical protein
LNKSSDFVELLLQFFVGIIDAELFETVAFEKFKAINVEHANESLLVHMFGDNGVVVRVGSRAKGAIDSMHARVEQTRIQMFRQRVAIGDRLKRKK